MLFRRARQDEVVFVEGEMACGGLHEWVLSLPWVVERPFSLEAPGVRCFAVDCEPLGRRQLWLVTGLDNNGGTSGPGITMLVPQPAANAMESTGQGRVVAPMPDGHALVTMDASSCQQPQEVEALLLTAYRYAMS